MKRQKQTIKSINEAVVKIMESDNVKLTLNDLLTLLNTYDLANKRGHTAGELSNTTKAFTDKLLHKSLDIESYVRRNGF